MLRKPLLVGLPVSALLLGFLGFATRPASSAQEVVPFATDPLYLPLVMKNAGGPTLGGCSMFPPDNPWNTDISNYPVHPNSAGR